MYGKFGLLPSFVSTKSFDQSICNKFFCSFKERGNRKKHDDNKNTAITVAQENSGGYLHHCWFHFINIALPTDFRHPYVGLFNQF